MSFRTCGSSGVKKPFARVVRANIGDCHELGQPPIIFIRQVLSVVACPTLLNSADVPKDVKQRARDLLADCTKSSVGAYSPSNGLGIVRSAVAQYITARDGGVPASVEDIYLGSGASDVIKAVLSLFVGEVDGKPPAVMIPIPQYPLFSGTLAVLGITQAHYYLEESSGWALTPASLEASWLAASEGCRVRALVVINPGNPTGQVLIRENIEEAIKFAYNKKLFILADEVYQENIVSKPFHSFKKMKPPSPLDASYEKFSCQRRYIHRVLTERTRTAYKTFNSIPGYFCNELDGSMFAYPRVVIQARAQQVATQLHMSPDEFYCLQLLEKTGVCVIPGSGFGQQPGTFHFRTTILHPREEFQHMMDSIRRFHHSFLLKYSDEEHPQPEIHHR